MKEEEQSKLEYTRERQLDDFRQAFLSAVRSGRSSYECSVVASAYVEYLRKEYARNH